MWLNLILFLDYHKGGDRDILRGDTSQCQPVGRLCWIYTTNMAGTEFTRIPHSDPSAVKKGQQCHNRQVSWVFFDCLGLNLHSQSCTAMHMGVAKDMD